MSFKSDVGETEGVMHPETEFPSCEPVTADVSCASIVQWWDGRRTDFPFQKEGKQGEGRADRF